MAVGDPHTRPEEDTVFIPNSLALVRDARDWESCALVPWAMHLPRNAGARDIAELLARELHIQRRDITVTLHQPEPYLIRFEDPTTPREACRRGRFTGAGIDLCLRPWYGLSHALALRMFYRVRLFLDGIPSHAWTPEIVERIIGRRCALQRIFTDLVQQEDTRHIELWAWAMDPSEIPRMVWVGFTHRPAEASSMTFTTTEPPPDVWHQGARFRVFLHLGLLEDYSALRRNLQEAVDNPVSVTPICRRYTWRYGVIDGVPPGALSTFPARLPKPPRLAEGDHREPHQVWGHEPRPWPIRGPIETFGRDGPVRAGHAEHHDDNDDRVRRRSQPRPGNDESGINEEAALRWRLLEHHRGRVAAAVGSCKTAAFTWPHRGDRDDDHDDGHDYEHPGHSSKYNDAYWGTDSTVRRDRTRSPPRRNYGAPVGMRHDGAQLRALFAGSLNIFTKGQRLHLPIDNKEASDLAGSLSFADRFNKLANTLTATDDTAGERAWSDPVSIGGVFTRLKTALLLPPKPTLEIHSINNDLHQERDGIPDGSPEAHPQAANDDSNGHGPMMLADVFTGAEEDDAEAHGEPMSDLAHTMNGGDGIDSLFCRPEPAALGPPPLMEKCQRQRRVFDMSNLRRSARLSTKPAIPAAVKARRNLCRKLGLVEEDVTPMEEVLKNLLDMFTGPLPECIIGAMTTIFDLDDEGADDITNALISHAGDSIDDLRLQELQLHDAATA